MPYPEIIESIDQEISKLRQARSLFDSLDTRTTPKSTEVTEPREKRTYTRRGSTMSEEARARIGAAAKRRWAEQRKS